LTETFSKRGFAPNCMVMLAATSNFVPVLSVKQSVAL
jgi:hypothetical protein